MVFSDVVKEVIRLCESAQEYWATELPKRHPHYPLVRSGEDSGPPPEAEQRLHQLVRSLPGEAVYKLALLLCLGRGDFTTDDLARKYAQLEQRFGKPDRAANQMLDMASLGEYLTDGMEQLERSHIDVDTLLESVAS